MNPLSKYSSAEDIRRAIEELARGYAPEWRFTKDAPDGGGALALVFADMFGETAERLGRVPYKYFLYFLNLIEATVRSVSPATGLASFKLSDDAENIRRIPAGTQLYADAQTAGNEGTRVIFETESEITAVPSNLIGLYCSDPRRNIINRYDTASGEAKLFYPDKAFDIQKHEFSILDDDVLNISKSAQISLKLENKSARYIGIRNIEKLSDPAFASWRFFRNGVSSPVLNVCAEENILRLEVGVPDTAQSNGNPDARPCLTCRMEGHFEHEIFADALSVGSSCLAEERGAANIVPDAVYFNDISLDPQNPGYLFGKEPIRYDSLLISCDEALSKHGAEIGLEFTMHTVIREIGTAPSGLVYDWDGRYIIEKKEGREIIPDNLYISEIVWEYHNDAGWAHLPVKTSGNPFHSSEGVKRERIVFDCPHNMTRSFQNSVRGYWIRARVIRVENPYSQFGRRQLPYAESISFDYDYGHNLQPVREMEVTNNAETIVYNMTSPVENLKLFKPMEYAAHAVYLAFDKPPHGLPLSVYFGISGFAEKRRSLSFERLSRDASGIPAFKQCRVTDGTDGFRNSGVISFFISNDTVKSRIFGLEAYWLRIVDTGLRYVENETAAIVNQIELNAVGITQKQTVFDEYYSAERYASGKVIALPERPVLHCEVFVDETDDIANAGSQDSGTQERAWIKWDVPLSEAGPNDRGVDIDMRSGTLRFGNGVNGRVLPAGMRNIRVNYSFGGGTKGNLPVGAITGLVSSISNVDSATNFTSTGGGNDKEDIKTFERVGPARLRHRGRAVTPGDFESLVTGEFPEIRAAKVFSGLDGNGRFGPGCVTVVLLPTETKNREQTLRICRNAYRFLAENAHFELIAANRLSVVPALIITINVTIEALAQDITAAAATERTIIDAVSATVDGAGKSIPEIGRLPAPSEFFECLRSIPNLAYVDRISLEGQYFEGNVRKIIPLTELRQFPFACAENGSHLVLFTN